MRNRLNLPAVALALLIAMGLSRPASGASSENVVIYRDSFGMPHVFAESNYGVFYGAGYAIAQDRLNQMHQFRLLAEGRLAEAAGPEYLASDCQVRQDLGGLPEAQIVLSQIGEPYVGWVNAYTDGINRAMEDLGMSGHMEPWRPADTMAVLRYIVWDFSNGKVAELERAATFDYLLTKFDKATAEAMWRDLMSPIDPGAVTTIPAAAPTRAESSYLLPDFEQPGYAPVPSLKNETASRPRLGSNAIAVAPERSATGNPLLISNTQLEIHFPAVYYEEHLRGGDFDVIGFTMPGFPAIGFGHNAKMAWTITVGCSDQQDIYEETIRKGPAGKIQYLFKGNWLDCSVREEVIPVKGYSEPVHYTIYSTIHGPLEALDLEKGRAYATRWGPYLNGDSLKAFFELDRAKNLDEFAEALSKVEMSFNFLYADVDGNIAYWHAGKLPQRAKGHSGVMPVSGTGDFEWQGFVPFNQLPHLINPKEKIILLENNMPSPDSPEYDAFLTNWGTQRIERLKQLADALPEKVRAQDLEHIMSDTRYLVADKLKPELLRACKEQKNPRVKEATTLLEEWDNTIASDSAGATLFYVWLQNLGREMLMDEFGEHCVPSLTEKPHLPLILHAFEGSASTSPPSRDYFDNINTPRRESKDDIILISLTDAIRDCERYFKTPDMNRWRWGQFSYWPLGPLGQIPDLYMDQNYHHTDVLGGGASLQFIEAEAGFSSARNLMPPGNSGDPRSPHSGDQIERFTQFNYKPMPFDSKEIRQSAESRKTLVIERP